jgi:hypothetical protein
VVLSLLSFPFVDLLPPSSCALLGSDVDLDQDSSPSNPLAVVVGSRVIKSGGSVVGVGGAVLPGGFKIFV